VRAQHPDLRTDRRDSTFPAPCEPALQAAAQADAVKNGGGVVYFPAGTYAFANNISLSSGVLIRGAPVNGAQAKNGKNPGNLLPTTVFTCPNRMHQGIWNFAPDAANLGVVNVLLDQCAVMLWPSLKTNSFSPMMSAWWFGASDINGSESGGPEDHPSPRPSLSSASSPVAACLPVGSNKIVMGNYVRDVSLGQSLLAPSSGNVYPYGAWAEGKRGETFCVPV
jgi:hypothetical protein